MRFKLILCMALLLPQLAAAGAEQRLSHAWRHWRTQEAPPFMSCADMVARMTGDYDAYIPPNHPPRYEIGQRKTFNLQAGEDFDEREYEMELRAQTQRVVIWVQQDVDYPRWRAESLARRVETHVLDPVQKRLNYVEPPGIDGDPRLMIALVHDEDGSYAGYFSLGDTVPHKLASNSNQMELVVINLARDDEFDFYDKILVDYIAHEFTHVLHHHSDYGEERWLDESLATYVGFHASKPFLSWSTGQGVADDFLETPEIGLTEWYTAEYSGAKYGVGFLFMMYLTQQFGDEIAMRLLVEQTNGWQSIIKVLREYTDKSADEVFADWVLANYFLDARRGYGYRELDADLTPPSPAVSLNSFPAEHKGELPQYASEYIGLDVRGADQLLVRLWQDTEARLFGGKADQGGAYAYAIPADFGNNRLTRAINLDASGEVLLEFRLWYELARELEYAYVIVSEDDGKTWQTLRGKYTRRSDVYSDYYDQGYTGEPRYWRREVMDLSEFAPGEILLGFELMSNYNSSYRGVAIDEIRIDAIDFHEDFAVAGRRLDGRGLDLHRQPPAQQYLAASRARYRRPTARQPRVADRQWRAQGGSLAGRQPSHRSRLAGHAADRHTHRVRAGSLLIKCV